MERAPLVCCGQRILEIEGKEDVTAEGPRTAKLRLACRRGCMDTVHHQHVNFESRHVSAELQGRRLRIIRLSHDTSHPRLIFIRENIRALKELRSLSEDTLIPAAPLEQILYSSSTTLLLLIQCIYAVFTSIISFYTFTIYI